MKKISKISKNADGMVVLDSCNSHLQGPDLHAFLGFIGSDDDGDFN